MQLNIVEKDALSELINIGFGRAAKALSELSGLRVVLEAPNVEIYPVSELNKALPMFVGRDIVSVHQVFSGRLAGDMVLLLDNRSASALVKLLNSEYKDQDELTAEDMETLTEVANIVLSAFCGSFGNLLKVRIELTVPNLRLETFSHMLSTLTVEETEVRYLVLVKIRFRLSEGTVIGYVVIALGVHSLETMFESMKAEGYLV